MNKAIKITILILVGLMLIGLGSALGGKFIFKEYFFKDSGMKTLYGNNKYLNKKIQKLKKMERDLEMKKQKLDEDWDFTSDNPISLKTGSLKGIKNVDISIKAGHLQIETSGDSDYIEVITENIDEGNFLIKEKGDTLMFNDVTPKSFIKKIWTWNNRHIQIKMIIPANFAIEKLTVCTGAGRSIIKEIKTEKLILDCGVGDVIFKYSEIKNKTLINAGVGTIRITDSVLNNLNFNSGVGSFEFHGKLYGKNRIEGGIGEINMMIENNIEDYKFDFDMGLGSITVNGDNLKSFGKHIGNKNSDAPNSIFIEGGLGRINVEFAE